MWIPTVVMVTEANPSTLSMTLTIVKFAVRLFIEDPYRVGANLGDLKERKWYPSVS